MKEGTEEKVAPLSLAALSTFGRGRQLRCPARGSQADSDTTIFPPPAVLGQSLWMSNPKRGRGGGGEHTSPREKVAKMQSKAGKASVNNTAKTLPLVFQETHNKMTFSRETYTHKQKHRAI